MATVDSMKILKQTYKTIIIDKFNDDSHVYGLDQFLENNDNPTGDQMFQDVRALEVHSFEEFLEKFAPKVYEVCEAVGNQPTYYYTTDLDKVRGKYYTEQKITSNAYYTMISQMYANKGTSNSSNLDFKDEDILNMITPKEEIRKAKRLRSQMNLNLEKYYVLKTKGENANEFAIKFKNCRKEIVEEYRKSHSALIPLLLQDLNTKIERCNKLLQPAITNKNPDQNGESLLSAPAGVLMITASGDLKVAERKTALVPVLSEQQQNVTVQVPTEIEGIIRSDFEKNSPDQNEYVKSLVLSTFAPIQQAEQDSNLPVDIKTLEEQRNKYISQKEAAEKIYCQAKQAFIEEMTKVLSKLMGVKVFFDHATVKGGNKGTLSEPVIIANCTATDLLRDGVKEKFEDFIKQRGKDISGKIWFAILPGVVDNEMESEEGVEQDEDPFADISSIEINDKKALKEDFVSLNSAKALLKIMEAAHVMTVFNFASSKHSGFAEITAEYINEKKSELESVGYGHAVFAYPNFTLLRNREIKLEEDSIAPSFSVIKVPNFYIDAAYVATGLLVASQQQDYLRDHGFKDRINTKNVCTHVDLEDNLVKQNLTTKFNRETALNWDGRIREAIAKDMFGFAFCGDEKVKDDNTPVINTYVYCARTLQKGNELYKPIYRVLTEDFIQTYLKTKMSMKESVIKQFTGSSQGEVKGWKEESKKKDTMDKVNLILKGEEDIVYDQEHKKIVIKFNNDEATLEDVTIVSDGE